ncbi:2Fe-2S iron-sulfur cluster-binding protein [Phenylobacterium sp.]|uniref:2Fe-2S iron-sulfur cluster-binding protein n=1 Tax=Phenylobacterium sp. TaxID=1871053 RepID=UPI0025E65C53|nr:2Fe-2S iron-sulfur cluster-binding protein [Phenylobacterium sp.]MBX3482034.1 (2Fe-2S)-binding protein [Phenylobacterium sp.]MCW5760039.1 (2Fe-2S)-binding protein [Phenylobacterium sp.]
MVKVTYVEHGGARHELDGRAGSTVMETAVRNNVPGIDADCGGACACATCHVYVDGAWLARTGARTAMEDSMLEFADGVEGNSRLACQIRLTPDLDGLVVRLPESQH